MTVKKFIPNKVVKYRNSQPSNSVFTAFNKYSISVKMTFQLLLQPYIYDMYINEIIICNSYMYVYFHVVCKYVEFILNSSHITC